MSQLLADCVQHDGFIYPKGKHGPVVTNVHDTSHTQSLARHTGTGIVALAYCRAFISTPVGHDGIAAVGKAVQSLLTINAPLLGFPAGYTHAYVLEGTTYAAQVSGCPREVAELAAKMTGHLLSGRAETGLWRGQGMEQRSVAYFSALVAERLLWASQAKLVDRVQRKEAVEATTTFLRRVSEELTDRSTGGVLVQQNGAETDFGSTARCLRLALQLGEDRLAVPWLQHIQSAPCRIAGLVGPMAHTHTWEATALLADALSGPQVQNRVSQAVRLFRQHSDKSVALRLMSALGPVDPEIIEGIERLLGCEHPDTKTLTSQ
jgi:hypothetical protein